MPSTLGRVVVDDGSKCCCFILIWLWKSPSTHFFSADNEWAIFSCKRSSLLHFWNERLVTPWNPLLDSFRQQGKCQCRCPSNMPPLKWQLLWWSLLTNHFNLSLNNPYNLNRVKLISQFRLNCYLVMTAIINPLFLL